MEKKILPRGIFFCFPTGLLHDIYKVPQNEIRADCSPLPEIIATSLVHTLYIIIYRQIIAKRPKPAEHMVDSDKFFPAFA